MQSRFSFYCFLLLLPAVADCAGLSSIGDTQVLAGVAAKPERTQETVVQPRKTRPSELTTDLVYAVLVGQIAGQRGEQAIAFTHFLRAARLVWDPRLAELADNAALALDDITAMQQTADVWLELSPDAISAYQLTAYTRLEADDVSAAM